VKLIKSSISRFTKYLFFTFFLYPWDEAFAWSGRYSGWHMGPGMMGGFGGWFMIAFWILVLFGLILLIRWMLQITNTEKGVFGGKSDALNILKVRYAKGEIDKDEFEAKKMDLAN
jgi:putative membrane protein